MSWFRYYESALDDPKVQRLPGELFKSWVNILCLAKRHRGVLPSLTDIAFALRKSEEITQKTISQLKQAGLLDEMEIGLQPHNWNERQFQSDVSTARVKRFRERHKIAPETPSEYRVQSQTTEQKEREDPAAIAAPPIEDAHEQVAEVQVVDDRGPEVLPSSTPATGDLPAACADQPSIGGMGAALGMGAEALGDGNGNLGGNGKARRAGDDARDAWNTVAARCGWPTVQRFSEARQKALTARLAEIGGFDGWQTMLAKAEASDFLSGRSARTDGHSNWSMTFDWATKPANLTKIMEGNYDNKSPGPATANGRGPTAGFAAAALALRDKEYSGL